MHALEKILARASGRKKVTAGEIVFAKVDVAEVNDLYLQVVKSFYELGGTEVANPDKTTFVFDHYSPAPTIKAAYNHKSMREFCSKMGIRHLFDIGEGVCHQVLAESGMVGPGKIVVETDSHTTTMGALGAFGTGVGATDMAVILITGKLWFKVPRVMKVVLEGDLRDGVMAKDEGADPSFASTVKTGDIIVAGTNFGCGSSREHAVITLKNAGVGAVIARSFARIFFRNAINQGLVVVEVPNLDTLNINTGDKGILDVVKGNFTANGQTVFFQPLTEHVLSIIEAGGIFSLFREKGVKAFG